MAKSSPRGPIDDVYRQNVEGGNPAEQGPTLGLVDVQLWFNKCDVITDPLIRGWREEQDGCDIYPACSSLKGTHLSLLGPTPGMFHVP